MTPFRATYRLQLRGDTDFAAARELVPQLAQLGVSHLYLSPVLRARRGSSHGYDVVDPGAADPALGGEAGLEALVEVLRHHRMGLVLDIVPNHMAADPESPAFADVLAHGPASRFAAWFDVDWGSAGEVEAGRHTPLALPWLGAPWREAAGRGEIALVRREGQVRLRHGKGWLPLDPHGLAPLLAAAARRAERRAPEAARRLGELARRARQLPPRAPARADERAASVAAWQQSLGRLLRGGRPARQALDAELAEATPVRGSGGAARLERVLAAQPYRLGFWRRTARRLNWRRFFDIDDLIALRCEDPEVFAATHARILAWVEAGWLEGLRIDHVDGLLDPAAYLRRLRREVSERLPLAMRSHFGLWVEKILAADERLPQAWPVDGSTGYEFARDVDALLLEPEGAAAIEADWRRRTGVRRSFSDETLRAKRLAVDELLTADLERTTTALVRELEQAEPSASLPSRAALRAAVRETVVHLGRYRTYLDVQGNLRADARDAARAALAAARRGGRAPDEALARVERHLLGGGAREPRRARTQPPGFVERLQQLSGPAAAKGIEDTALYRHTPLLSRCEVGSAPEAALDRARESFHAGCRERGRFWPRNLLAATTHDTKRSADVRARLDALSECPKAWTRLLDALEEDTAPLRRWTEDGWAPDRQDVHMIVQLLLGVWPLDARRGRGGLPPVPSLRTLASRLEGAALKSAREARRHTSWTDAAPDYEAALADFARGLLDPRRSPAALARIEAFARKELAGPALWNVLARVVLQAAAPGVPDLYQGDELLCLGLVDPDNRRPVDFAARRRALRRVAGLWEEEPERRRRALAAALAAPGDGAAKLPILAGVLAARRAHPTLFRDGAYLPLHAEGPLAPHVVAFARRHESELAVVVAARWARAAGGDPIRVPAGEDVWEKTHLVLPPALAGRRLRSAFTGERLTAHAALPLGRILDPAPVALLLSTPRRARTQDRS